MNDRNTPTTVLVTGGSGFIGSWIIIQLLQRGYTVRATIRTLDRESQLRSTLATQLDIASLNRLSFFPADLLEDDGWQQATDGVDAVMHVASPMPVGEYRKTDVIRPAREGTLRVLKAAVRAEVKRVVLTSSLTAASPSSTYIGPPTDETMWTDLTAPHTADYPKAKTLAEQDAWAFVRAHGGKTALTTIVPGMVQGPVLGPDFSGSVELVQRMLNGKLPLYPNVGFSIVDVRDLADLHIRALESDRAAGVRFIGTGDFLWIAEIASLLREHFGQRAAKAPTRALPDVIIRLLAPLHSDLRFFAPLLHKRSDFSTTKAANILHWHPRPAKESILATAESLLSNSLV